jgi:hypothetical protein
MFCPKCGSQNAENVRFCRSCGLELEAVSAAMTGKLTLRKTNGEEDGDDENSNNPDKLWNSAIINFLVGLAFLIISVVLATTGAAGGRNWWFWMLIPAFWNIGSGAASYLKVKRMERKTEYANFRAVNPSLQSPPAANAALPPRQTLFANDYAPPAAAARDTGELFAPPASITENTTRHLNREAENPTAFFDTREKSENK